MNEQNNTQSNESVQSSKNIWTIVVSVKTQAESNLRGGCS